MMDVDINNLAEGDELNPSAYNPEDYPGKEVMVDYIKRNMDRPAVIPDLRMLSVNGKVVKDSMDAYLKNRNHLSSSNLKNSLNTPRMFYYDYENVFEKKERNCFKLGTFAHMAFAEPELFDRVKIEPMYSQSTKDGVIGAINFYKEVLCKRITSIGENKMDDLKLMRDGLKKTCEKKGFSFVNKEMYEVITALKRNYYWYGGSIIKSILKGAVSESSFYSKDEETGLKVRVRPDFFNIEENIGVNAVISLKTTSADNIGKFAYDCAKFRYELSEGMYQEVMSHVTGRNFNTTIMIMLQTVQPYDVAVLYWQPDDLQNGKYKYRYALSIVKDCFDKKIFPGFDALAEDGACGIIDFSLPEWSKKILHPVSVDYD